MKKLAYVEDYTRELDLTALLLVQHGRIVVSEGDITGRSKLHSCRKSFLSDSIGNTVARGQIHLDDNIASLGIDFNPPSLTAEEKTATVRMLLQARSGVYRMRRSATRDVNVPAVFRAEVLHADEQGDFVLQAVEEGRANTLLIDVPERLKSQLLQYQKVPGGWLLRSVRFSSMPVVSQSAGSQAPTWLHV